MVCAAEGAVHSVVLVFEAHSLVLCMRARRWAGALWCGGCELLFGGPPSESILCDWRRACSAEWFLNCPYQMSHGVSGLRRVFMLHFSTLNSYKSIRKGVMLKGLVCNKRNTRDSHLKEIGLKNMLSPLTGPVTDFFGSIFGLSLTQTWFLSVDFVSL